MQIRSPHLLSLIILPLLLSGCMTMGWSGVHDNRSRTGTQNQILVKERQIENYTLVAEFPSSVVGEEVQFTLEIEGQRSSKEKNFESVFLKIHKQNGRSIEKTFTQLQPDYSLSTATRLVFPYRFDEAGVYDVTFAIDDPSGNKQEPSYAISTTLSVPESYVKHQGPFNSTTWIVAGSAVMVGMMIWMMAE